MPKLLLSIQGGRALHYMFKKVPSDLIPFKGKFPLVEDYRLRDVYKELQQHRYLDECSDWVQKAVINGDNIYLLVEGFENYLKKVGKYDKKDSLSETEKAELLARFMDENCIGDAFLIIK